jgi:hypothetical protein
MYVTVSATAAHKRKSGVAPKVARFNGMTNWSARVEVVAHYVRTVLRNTAVPE